MTDTIELYAPYGEAMSFGLSLADDGHFELLLQGNGHPWFPPLEMGEYAGEDRAVVSAFVAEIRDALPASANNARTQIGAAFLSVMMNGTPVRSFDLYDPPAAIRP